MTYDDARGLLAREAAMQVSYELRGKKYRSDLPIETIIEANRILAKGEPERAPGQVYFLRRGRLVKIGFTKNPEQRIRNLELQAGQKVKVLGIFPGTYQDESTLHKRFKQYREIGEWFRNEGEVKAFARAPVRSWREFKKK